MKKTVFILLLAAIGFQSNAQQSCCMSSELAFYSEKSFIDMHPSPLPFSYDAKVGKMITFKAPDGKDASAFEVNGSNPNNVILMFHEWWGLNDYIKQEAEKVSKSTGATVLALDLYDGQLTTDAKQASVLAKGLVDERVRAIISGAVEYKGREVKLQTMGWCMGGMWSLQAALMVGPQAKGSVMYYGMPETDKTKLSKLACPVLGIFATKDQHISPEVVNTFQQSMKELNKKLVLHNYEADHAFANPSNPKHDKAASADAMEKTIVFLKRNFERSDVTR